MEAEVLSRELAEQGLGVKEATAAQTHPSVLEPIEYAQYPCSEPACGSMASHPLRHRGTAALDETDKQSLRCGLS